MFKKQHQTRAGEKPPAPEAPKGTKQATILELVSREGGATVGELTSATGWQPHTLRAAITGLRKRGSDIRVQRVDGISRYIVEGRAS